jgi:hypothetical protein
MAAYVVKQGIYLFISLPITFFIIATAAGSRVWLSQCHVADDMKVLSLIISYV